MQNGPWPQPIRWSPKQSISLWQWQKEEAVSKNKGTPNQRQRATANSAGGVASPS